MTGPCMHRLTGYMTWTEPDTLTAGILQCKGNLFQLTLMLIRMELTDNIPAVQMLTILERFTDLYETNANFRLFQERLLSQAVV